MSGGGAGSGRENLRVRRTRRLLREALVELIEERGFERVTVGEITGRAMVSRAAFYRNYRDKYHLVEQIFDEAMAALLGTVEGGAVEDGTDAVGTDAAGSGAPAEPPAERWVRFFEHIDAYHRFYGALLGARGSGWFAARMRASLTAMVRDHLPVPAPAAPPSPSDDLAATVLGAVFTESITWWLAHDRPTPPRAIAARSASLAGAVLTTANAWSPDPPSAPRRGAPS